jgi:hypothetical protein
MDTRMDSDGLTFRLPDAFLEPYRDRTVDWGYPDAAGNSLGEITFLRTYSRIKPDGTKERWWEVCRRVVEGMFSIQKDHVKANRLPWNDRKAQASAQDAYERMFTFRWTPPGRGLWMMGTPLVNVHRNSAALQNCFTADTRFITREGIRSLGDVVNQDVEVWAEGDWRKASVQAFGTQPVQRITFGPSGRRSNVRHVEVATPDHRWQLEDGSLTTALAEGDVVAASAVWEDFPGEDYQDGYRHGLIFGDGSINYTYANGDFSHSIRLCGPKAKYASCFDRVSFQPNCDGDPVAYQRSSANLKLYPVSDSSPSYMKGFIDGWYATDGSHGSTYSFVMNTQSADAYQWLLDYAAYGGYVVVGHSVDGTTETNYGPRSAPLHKITLAESDTVAWRVKSIELLEEEERVYCAVVPDVERFTLASGIYTSNCAFVSTADMNRSDPTSPFTFLMEASMLGIGVDILDIANLIGVCVVSGNVRRSAELAMGSIGDKAFLEAKNYGGPGEDPAERAEWGWMSNNSVEVQVGDDLTPILEGIARNGEPGVIWLDVSRQYGRLIDAPTGADHRVAGYNPCAEQSLESFECCTLVETFLNRHDDLDDFKRTLKVAYLYAKTVTLLPTHWEKTNAIMQRNRRIGTGVSGFANFADRHGMSELRTWLNTGYGIVQYYDEIYSEWLCVRQSIKTTTVKPSGTVSILAGESPGVHWSPGGTFFDRGIVFNENDPLVTLLRAANYDVEDSAYTPGSVFVQFPVHSLARRSEDQVSLFEKANLAVLAQRYWSDNSVSVTLSFDPATEAEHVGTVLHMHEGQLKTLSFLPRGNTVYQQMPYQESTENSHLTHSETLFRINLNPIYDGDLDAIDAIGERYCTTDACEIRPVG